MPRLEPGMVPERVDGAHVHPANDMVPPALAKLSALNEKAWLSIGSAAEAMEDYTRAFSAYDSALLHNPYSVPALGAMATMYRTLDHFDLAVECFQRVLNITPDNGEVWGAMGHCYLMMDELQKAYTAYHQALYYLPNPNDPKLWYGIGILYDRYGSLEHAEETFRSVVRMDPNYEKSNEIYFRLGIIYKQQGQYEPSLECFRYILHNPPTPLTEMDICFQIGHVYEQQQEYRLAKEAYERVLANNPNHAKVLQQLGGLYMQAETGFMNHDTAIALLTQSLDSDANDQKSWYLLGRAYMEAEEYNRAYEAYQQTVYRDGKNPALWCSIGILYFHISQFHDALGAYSRSIRLNPYISEVWFNLGNLYESCNNQISDAVDAYRRALDLDPDNAEIKQRLQLLQAAQSTGQPVPAVPAPRDLHPSVFTTAALAGPDAPWEDHPPDGAEMQLEGPPPNELYSPAPEDSGAGPTQGPPDIALPLSRAKDERPGSPKLPSYAATYADYRNEANTAGYPPAASRSHQGAPYEWDRPYYHGYSEGAHDRPRSSMRYPHEPKGERLRYDGAPPARPYTPSVRSPPLVPLSQRGRDEGETAEPAAHRIRPRTVSDTRPSHESGARKRDPSSVPSARAPGVNKHARKPSGSVARMTAHGAGWDEAPASTSLARRNLDEDYDEGAASALMGLAGAAASAYEASNAHRTAAKHPMDTYPAESAKRPRHTPGAAAAAPTDTETSTAARGATSPRP